MKLAEEAGRPAHYLPAALAVLALAVALRAPWLSRLGLQGDEDISTLAFRGILATGIPTLPSGHFYWRGALYSYLAAPLAAFGIDWLPRVLSVLLSCGTALLLVRLGPRWVGRTAAVVAALFFALSLAEIHVARQARFYVLYQLLAFLLLYALYRFTETGAGRWAAASLAAGVTAMAAHELGVTLAALLVIPVLRPLPRRSQGMALGVTALFGGSGLLRRQLVDRTMTGGALTIAERGGPIPQGLDEALANAGPAVHGVGLLALLLAALAAGLLGWWAAREKGSLERGIAAAAFACTVALAGARQVGVALCGLVVLALVSAHLLPGRRGRTGLVILTGTLAVAGAAWLAWDLAHGGSLRHAVRDLGGGPLEIALGLLQPLAIAVPALLGAAAILVAALRGRTWDGPRFLLLCVTILVAVRGLLAAKIEDRYMADAWLLWELLAGFALIEGARRMAVPLRRAVAAVALVAVLLLPGTAPAQTFRYLRRGPGEVARGVFPPLVPDLRGAARFIRAHASPGDRIAATDWLSTYCYLGRVDLWLRSEDWQQQAILVEGIPREFYLDARVVPTLVDLEEQRAGGAIWVVAGGLEMYQKTGKLEPGLRRLLKEAPAVWVGRDGWTRVLRLDAR